MSNQNINTILDNLKELDIITQHVSTDMQQKNKILQGGLNDCRSCRLQVDKINKRINLLKKLLSNH